MEREMGCPICKKKVLFVGVHDDEGNYHGLVGCEYENNPWSGLSYALHHEGWGECPLCTDGEYGPMGGMLFDTAEEAINALTPPNEPLTLEQLREMDGEPVWVQTPGIPKYGRWVIVAGVDTEDGQRTLYCQGDYTCRNYGRDWIAHRRPPEGET